MNFDLTDSQKRIRKKAREIAARQCKHYFLFNFHII